MCEIPGYSMYGASKDGRIWSYKKRLWLKPFSHYKAGHLCVKLWEKRKRHSEQVHRLILITFVGPCPKGMECCHWDGNPKNNTLENLRWDTRSANRFDSVRHGTHTHPDNRGTNNGRCKLSETDVLWIRFLYHRKTFYQYELGEIFGVSQPMIGDIVNRKSWSHL